MQAHGGFLYAFNSVAERPWPKEFGTATPNFKRDDREKTLDAALLRQIDEYNLLCSDKKGHKTLDATHLTRSAFPDLFASGVFICGLSRSAD